MTHHTLVNPEALGGRPRGYSNGVLAVPGRLLFVAGQIGWDRDQRLVSRRFSEQFERALENVLAVVREAGGAPQDICRLILYVVDKKEYAAEEKSVGTAYRSHMGRHYPAMTLLEVGDLLEPGARVEIEATAVIPQAGDAPEEERGEVLDRPRSRPRSR